MKKKQAIILGAIVLTILSVQGQTVRLAYDYDAAGNRIARRVVTEQPVFAPRQPAPATHGLGDVSVVPTVTTGDVNISTTADLSQGGLPWTLTDIQGRVIAQGTMTSQMETVTINGGPGVYLINVTTAEAPSTFRIIKQ